MSECVCVCVSMAINQWSDHEREKILVATNVSRDVYDIDIFHLSLSASNTGSREAATTTCGDHGESGSCGSPCEACDGTLAY